MAPDFVWQDGVRIAGTTIWCDAPRCHQVTFVSSAARGLGDAGAGRLILTERTLALLGRAADLTALRADGAASTRSSARGLAAPSMLGRVLVTPFGRPFALGRLRLELLPSGHLPGAAQLLVERPGKGDARRLLYAGDLNPRTGGLGEPAQVRAADAVVMSAPLAPLTVSRSLPERAEQEAALVAVVKSALAQGRAPVLLVPPFGAAAEAAVLLGGAGVRLAAHPYIAHILDGYRTLGLFDAQVASARAAAAASAALLWPRALRDAAFLVRSRRAPVLLVGGEAVDPDAVSRTRADSGFALADHGDLPSLVEHVVQTGAEEVLLTSGFSEPVARAFAARRIGARPFGPPEQIQLFRS